MTTLGLVLALAVAPQAHAQLAGRGSAVWGDVGGGLGVAGSWDRPVGPQAAVPVLAGGAWSAGIGGLVGRYDDGFAIGRGVGFGVRAHQDLLPATGGLAIQTTAAFEAWRAIDLLVVSLRVGGLAGPVLRTTPDPRLGLLAGGTVRALGVAAYRFHRAWQVQVRLEAGVDVVDVQGVRVTPAVGVLAGLGFLVPVSQATTR